METIHNRAKGALQELQQSSTKSQQETSQKTDFPISWTSALFKKFQAIYGHKWTSAIEGIEETAVEEWSRYLAGLTGDQIKLGLDTWQEDWPPSAVEFKRYCLGQGKKLNEFGLDYVPQCYRTENRITDKSRLLSSDEREVKRDEYREKIGGLKDILRG